MLTIDELRHTLRTIADGTCWTDEPREMLAAITDTTPADAEWFREIGAGEVVVDDHLELTLGLLSFALDATEREFRRPWYGWALSDVYGDVIDPWPTVPPTRGQVICLLLGLGDTP